MKVLIGILFFDDPNENHIQNDLPRPQSNQDPQIAERLRCAFCRWCLSLVASKSLRPATWHRPTGYKNNRWKMVEKCSNKNGLWMKCFPRKNGGCEWSPGPLKGFLVLSGILMFLFPCISSKKFQEWNVCITWAMCLAKQKIGKTKHPKKRHNQPTTNH